MDDPKAFPLHKKHSQAQIFKPLRRQRAAYTRCQKKKREREQIVTFISMMLLKTQTLGDLEGTLHRKGIYVITSYPNNNPMEKPQSANHTGPGRAKGVDPSGSWPQVSYGAELLSRWLLRSQTSPAALSTKTMTFWGEDCSCSSKQTQGLNNMTPHWVFLL